VHQSPNCGTCRRAPQLIFGGLGLFKRKTRHAREGLWAIERAGNIPLHLPRQLGAPNESPFGRRLSRTTPPRGCPLGRSLPRTTPPRSAARMQRGSPCDLTSTWSSLVMMPATATQLRCHAAQAAQPGALRPRLPSSADRRCTWAPGYRDPAPVQVSSRPSPRLPAPSSLGPALAVCQTFRPARRRPSPGVTSSGLPQRRPPPFRRTLQPRCYCCRPRS